MKKSNILLVIGVIIASLLIASWVYDYSIADDLQNSQLNSQNSVQSITTTTFSLLTESIIQPAQKLIVNLF